MKILIICNGASGLYKFRGLLIRELIKRKNDVVAIIPESKKTSEVLAENNLKELQCGLKRVSIERRGMNPIKDIILMIRYYRQIKFMKPDLVITYTIKPNIYGGFASRLLKIPYVVNITGLGTAFQNNGFLKKIVVLMYKVALRKAKVTFFENVENKNIFINEEIVQEEKTCVLAGAGVDLEYFNYTKYPEDNDAIYFLFVGRVMREKGIDELFAAMKQLRNDGYDCVLHIVGGFEENYKEKVEKYEKEGWLRYHGYQNDVRPFIQKCHCFVLPSWHEGMANTNLECAAMGRPVITSNIHGCLEAVDDGVSGFLCGKKDRESLYLKMKEFIEMPFLDKEVMGIAGRKRMETLFDKKVVVETTINELMKGRM